MDTTLKQKKEEFSDPDEIQRARKEGVEFLSAPYKYQIDDRSYHTYATADHFWIKWRFRNICKIIPRDWDLGRAIEIGCGRGVTRKQIEQHYHCLVVGCDVNLSALLMDSACEGHRYFYDINQRRKEWKESFSTVFLLDVLEHIKEPVVFLESVNFHLKAGGLLIVNIPAFQFFYSVYDKVQGHVKRYNFQTIKRELHLSGFYIERAAYWGMTMLPIILIRKSIIGFFQTNYILKKGFQPGSRFIELILQILMYIECAFFSKPPIGSSLLVVARKR